MRTLRLTGSGNRVQVQLPRASSRAHALAMKPLYSLGGSKATRPCALWTCVPSLCDTCVHSEGLLSVSFLEPRATNPGSWNVPGPPVTNTLGAWAPPGLCWAGSLLRLRPPEICGPAQPQHMACVSCGPGPGAYLEKMTISFRLLLRGSASSSNPSMSFPRKTSWWKSLLRCPSISSFTPFR